MTPVLLTQVGVELGGMARLLDSKTPVPKELANFPVPLRITKFM
jgi:hypothetical protein